MGKKIFFLAPYPQGQAPSQRFRFEQYINFLESENYEIEFHPFLNQKTWNSLYLEGTFLAKVTGILGSFVRRFGLMFRMHKADHIFIHREASLIGPPVFEWIISKILRKKYTFDFDDAIWLPNYSESNAKFHRLKAYWKVKKIIKWADKIVAGNDFLKTYASKYNMNVVVIPTTVDLVNVHNQLTDYMSDKLTIGWTGTHTTMNYVENVLPVLNELHDKIKFDLCIISNQKPNINFPVLSYIKWNKESEIQDLSTFSVGIMPLENNEWSKGKCGFKGLQYMALGIPAVMSPVGVNSEIIENGVNGFLCDSPEEWKDCLEKLLSDSELRKTIGLNGRKTVEQKYSVQANKNNYLALFK